MTISKKELYKKAKRQEQWLRKELPKDQLKVVDAILGGGEGDLTLGQAWTLVDWVSLAISNQLIRQLKNGSWAPPTTDEIYAAQRAIDNRKQKINLLKVFKLKPKTIVKLKTVKSKILWSKLRDLIV